MHVQVRHDRLAVFARERTATGAREHVEEYLPQHVVLGDDLLNRVIRVRRALPPMPCRALAAPLVVFVRRGRRFAAVERPGELVEEVRHSIEQHEAIRSLRARDRRARARLPELQDPCSFCSRKARAVTLPPEPTGRTLRAACHDPAELVVPCRLDASSRSRPWRRRVHARRAARRSCSFPLAWLLAAERRPRRVGARRRLPDVLRRVRHQRSALRGHLPPLLQGRPERAPSAASFSRAQRTRYVVAGLRRAGRARGVGRRRADAATRRRRSAG